MSDGDKYILTIDQIPKHTAPYKCTFKDCQNKVDGFCSLCGEQEDPIDDASFGDKLEAILYRHMHKVEQAHKDAQRYRWLKEHVFEVLCEGRPADCNAKWMLPRLVAEDSTGRKFTFDEIIDIQMKRSGE